MNELIFTKQSNGKFTFSIKDNENATNYLLNKTICHQVKPLSIKIARSALEELMTRYDPNVDYSIPSIPHISILNDYVTRMFNNGGLETTIITMPNKIIRALITTPDGRIFKGSGRNKRIAKQEAAKKACEFYDI